MSPFVDFVSRLLLGGFIALMMRTSNLQSLLIPAALAQELLPNTRPGGFGARSWGGRGGGKGEGGGHLHLCTKDGYGATTSIFIDLNYKVFLPMKCMCHINEQFYKIQWVWCLPVGIKCNSPGCFIKLAFSHLQAGQMILQSCPSWLVQSASSASSSSPQTAEQHPNR